MAGRSAPRRGVGRNKSLDLSDLYGSRDRDEEKEDKPQKFSRSSDVLDLGGDNDNEEDDMDSSYRSTRGARAGARRRVVRRTSSSQSLKASVEALAKSVSLLDEEKKALEDESEGEDDDNQLSFGAGSRYIQPERERGRRRRARSTDDSARERSVSRSRRKGRPRLEGNSLLKATTQAHRGSGDSRRSEGRRREYGDDDEEDLTPVSSSSRPRRSDHSRDHGRNSRDHLGRSSGRDSTELSPRSKRKPKRSVSYPTTASAGLSRTESGQLRRERRHESRNGSKKDRSRLVLPESERKQDSEEASRDSRSVDAWNEQNQATVLQFDPLQGSVTEIKQVARDKMTVGVDGKTRQANIAAMQSDDSSSASSSSSSESEEEVTDKKTKKKKGLFGGFRRKKNSQEDGDQNEDDGEMSGLSLTFGSDGKGPSPLEHAANGTHMEYSFQELLGGVDGLDVNDGEKKKKGLWRRKGSKELANCASSSNLVGAPDEDEDLSESESESEEEADNKKGMGFGRYFGGRKKKESNTEDTAESDNESVSSQRSRRSIFGRRKRAEVKHQLLGGDEDLSGSEAF